MEERAELVEKALAGFSTDNPVEAEKSLFVAAGMALSAQAAGIALDEEFIERASSVVHDTWLSRNKEHATEQERVSYAELSEENKEKDRVFIRRIIDAL